MDFIVKKRLKTQISWVLVVMLIVTTLVVPVSITSSKPKQGRWWETVPEGEVTSK